MFKIVPFRSFLTLRAFKQLIRKRKLKSIGGDFLCTLNIVGFQGSSLFLHAACRWGGPLPASPTQPISSRLRPASANQLQTRPHPLPVKEFQSKLTAQPLKPKAKANIIMHGNRICCYVSLSAHKYDVRREGWLLAAGNKSGFTCQVERRRGRERKKRGEKKSTYL